MYLTRIESKEGLLYNQASHTENINQRSNNEEVTMQVNQSVLHSMIGVGGASDGQCDL
jgi:hypothetical protein